MLSNIGMVFFLYFTDLETYCVIQSSDDCQQEISFKCKNTPFMIGPNKKTWWTDIHGNINFKNPLFNRA